MFPTQSWTDLRRRLAYACAGLTAAAALVAASAVPARAIEVQCGASGDGDAFGWAVATGGDYDGDGVNDVAVGAPCAWVGSNEKNGRVRIFSGASGAVIESIGSPNAGERYGAALDFVPDLNNDGKAELVVGAPIFDAPEDGGGTVEAAGRVEVRSAKNGQQIVWEVYGPNSFANLGETVATLADFNGDGKREIGAGGSEAIVEGERTGVAYVLSGMNGTVLGQNDGITKGEHWASLVGPAGDANGDGKQDWFASSNFVSLPGEEEPPAEVGAATTTTTTTTTTSTTTTTLIDKAGRLTILSGEPPFEPLAELFGSDPLQRFGRAAAPASPDGGLSNLWIGSPGAKVSGILEAGAVGLFSGSGEFIRRVTEPSPQNLAGFGTSVVTPGSLDGGAGSDVVAGAPTARVASRPEVGRVHAFNGSSAGPALWSRSGTQTNERFGWSLDSGIDFNGDSIPDIVVGAPGATPEGKRGAGAAYLLSGSNGNALASFAGRRGRETRLFVAGPGLDRRPVIRAFDPLGRRREAEIRAFRSQPPEALSLAMLDQTGRTTAANMLLAVGGGPNSNDSTIAVYKAVRRRLRVSLFKAQIQNYAGGVNIAGGNFSTFASDEIAAAPANDVLTGTSNVTGTANIAIYKRFETDPFGRIAQWDEVREFAAYRPEDMVDGTTVDATGIHLAAGALEAEPQPNPQQDEIVASPAEGLPVVRVFSNTGVQKAQWRAYSPAGPSVGVNSGVSLAVANLKGDGNRQILTAPARGQLFVKAWNVNGQPFRMTPESSDVSFFVTQFGPTFEGGLRLGAADVDFDGADEIIVAPGPGIPGRILAFETTGALVQGWPDSAVSGQSGFQPFGPLATGGLSLIGTNDFWRR